MRFAVLFLLLAGSPCLAGFPVGKTACVALVAALGYLTWNQTCPPPLRKSPALKQEEVLDAAASQAAMATQSFHYGYGVIWNRDAGKEEVFALFSEREQEILRSTDFISLTAVELVTQLFTAPPGAAKQEFGEREYLNPTRLMAMHNRQPAPVASSSLHKCVAVAAILGSLHYNTQIVYGRYGDNGKPSTRMFVLLVDMELVADPEGGMVRTLAEHRKHFRNAKLLDANVYGFSGPHFATHSFDLFR